MQLTQLNWKCRFVTVKLTGNPTIDHVIIAIQATKDAEYSKTLSDNVSSGKRLHASNGWYVHGPPPFGATRFDVYAANELGPGEASTATGGGIMLLPNEEELEVWEMAAKWRVAGVSWDEIGKRLYERGFRGRRGGKFSHSTVKKYLTNRHLIGRVAYDHEHPDGSVERREAKAMWEPLVDTELFAAVEETARKRSRDPRARRRKKQHRFPLEPLCNHCGVSYVGNTYSKHQGRARSYHHPTPKARFDPEVHEAFQEAGCIEYHG